MPAKGATVSNAAITTMVSMNPGCQRCAGTTAATGSVISLPLLAEQSRRLDQKHDHHDHEDDSVRCLGIEDLGQALDDAQAKAGQDSAENRAHPADEHHCQDDDDQI